ncbi:MAG: VUT family protein, partial [Lachnospiraceae bacterium]|nr:VUT family protein [Lachnospiraceae bacterium]
KMKVRMHGKRLWERLIISTLIGEALDSAIFVLVSFAGVIPASHLFTTIFFQYMFKVLFEIVLIPVTYWLINTVKRREGIDVYDYNVKYNVF